VQLNHHPDVAGGESQITVAAIENCAACVLHLEVSFASKAIQPALAKILCSAGFMGFLQQQFFHSLPQFHGERQSAGLTSGLSGFCDKFPATSEAKHRIHNLIATCRNYADTQRRLPTILAKGPSASGRFIHCLHQMRCRFVRSLHQIFRPFPQEKHLLSVNWISPRQRPRKQAAQTRTHCRN
jgi:hypothetical protein